MTLIVDASVAIKWVVDEGDRADARALLESRHALVAPEFVLIEVANILWKKAAKTEIGPEQAALGLSGIEAAFSRFVPTALVLDRAMELALEVNHPVYDCLYLATAELEGCKLVTADDRLRTKLAGSPHVSGFIDMRAAVQ